MPLLSTTIRWSCPSPRVTVPYDGFGFRASRLTATIFIVTVLSRDKIFFYTHFMTKKNHAHSRRRWWINSTAQSSTLLVIIHHSRVWTCSDISTPPKMPQTSQWMLDLIDKTVVPDFLRKSFKQQYVVNEVSFSTDPHCHPAVDHTGCCVCYTPPSNHSSYPRHLGLRSWSRSLKLTFRCKIFC